MSNTNSRKLEEESIAQNDLFCSAKTRLIQNLETQLKCAEAMVKGEIYTVPSTKFATGKNATKKAINIPRAPRHWYWRDQNGDVRFCIRVFNKRIEIEKGQTDIIVGKDQDLPKAISSLLQTAMIGGF
ncbi:MAG: hypothetical protein HN521_07300, partial [Candidatus Latescibacteria bacterium]|nr:hypothetical protein [Candidatus Latescibacterota bacterium]